jgi:hypothetical protein
MLLRAMGSTANQAVFGDAKKVVDDLVKAVE